MNSKTGSGLSTKILVWVLCKFGSIGQNLKMRYLCKDPFFLNSLLTNLIALNKN